MTGTVQYLDGITFLPDGSGWISNDGNLNTNFTFDDHNNQHILFDQIYNLSKIVIKTGLYGNFYSGLIQYTMNGTTWNTIASVPNLNSMNGTTATVTLPSVTAAKGIRLNTTASGAAIQQTAADIDIYAMI